VQLVAFPGAGAAGKAHPMFEGTFLQIQLNHQSSDLYPIDHVPPTPFQQGNSAENPTNL
jgi:hypothetical protein